MARRIRLETFLERRQSYPPYPDDTIILAYKVVTTDFRPSFYPFIRKKLRYLIGKTVIERNFSTNPSLECASGLHVGTKARCILFRVHVLPLGEYRLMAVSFKKKDIVCIPTEASGKIRVKRLYVEKEVKTNWRLRT